VLQPCGFFVFGKDATHFFGRCKASLSHPKRRANDENKVYHDEKLEPLIVKPPGSSGGVRRLAGCA